MPNEAAFRALLAGFVLVLTRVGALFVFLPLPGTRAFIDAPKVVLTLAVTVMLFRFWVPTKPAEAGGDPLLLALGAEAALGLAAGTGLAIILEAMQLGAQFIALQAGFSYASTIDPNSEADSGILLIFTQLLTSLVIFAMGFDRQILAVLAGSFERIPAGSYHLTTAGAIGVLGLGSQMFQIGFRLSLPVMAILLVADVALALLGKIEQHLQLASLMFPIKTLAAVAVMELWH